MSNNLDFDARLGLLQSSDFAEYALSQGLTPHEALELPEVLSRSDLCVSPIVMDAIDEFGDTKEVILPCGTANALKCPSCAEFSARLRQRQIMRGIEGHDDSTTRVFLFTNTAPSWGRVHRSSIKPNDEYKVRHLWGHKKEKALLSVSRQRGACPCGEYHHFTDEKVGTPLNPKTYDYAGEVFWSSNLPSLVKSMVRTLRHIGKRLGIEPDSMGILTVFERQNRGSLHAHSLIVVRSNPIAAESFKQEIKSGWGTTYCPTAAFPDHRVQWFKSSHIARRWKEYGEFLPPVSLDKALPQVAWKNGELRPGTQFGEIWDFREVTATQNMDGDTDGQNGFKQAAGYLSKYLTKNQQAASPEALGTYSFSQSIHFRTLRLATAVLTLDVVMWESQKRYFMRKIKEQETARGEIVRVLGEIDAYSPEVLSLMEKEARATDQLQHLAEELRKVEVELTRPLGGHPLFPVLFPREDTDRFMYRVTASDIVLKAQTAAQQDNARGLSIVINKTMDNLGFTGTLISVSHWGCFLSDLKAEMKAWAEQNGHEYPDYEYVLRPDRMREVAIARSNPDKKQLSLFDLSTIGTVVKVETAGNTPWDKMRQLAKSRT